MSKFTYISHEEFPEDPYTKEIVFFEVHLPVRVMWTRNANKNGGLFWKEARIGVMKNGVKIYPETWEQDSNFLQKDMITFLEKRKWEEKIVSVFERPTHTPPSYNSKPQSMDEVSQQDQLPF